MSMETTCPHCRTTFRVTTEQLNAHQGDVRCGVCATLFNAFESLEAAREKVHEEMPRMVVAEAAAQEETIPEASEVEVAVPEAAPSAAAEAETDAPVESLLPAEMAAVTPEETPAAVETAAQEEAPPPSMIEAAAAEPEAAKDDSLDDAWADFAEAMIMAQTADQRVRDAASSIAASSADETTDEAAPVVAELIEYPPVAEPAPTEEPAAKQAAGAMPEAESVLESFVPDATLDDWEPPLRSKPRVWPWAIGSALLLLLGLVQAAYFYRVELAANYPATRAPLEQTCALLNCSVPLPRNADLLKIESSDLEADTEHPAQVTLATTMSNRARYRQAYPLLELTLTNHNDQAVARRVFTPAEYLAPGSDIKHGMLASSELSVRLALDLGELNAVGYRLYVFYPANR